MEREVDKTVVAIRTDLRVLLGCLKYQMTCPDLQKQSLLTIHSICENREDAVDVLREMGGVAFVYNLSISSVVHADVKETALFTLCTLADASVYCKTSLCRKETFKQVADWLMKEDIPLTQKRLFVYLLSVLVANNKPGQTLAQNTGCLDILLDLFRTTFPLSTEANFRLTNASQTYQLWASVSSALCGSVNNPQNEEGQRICVATFPIIKIWLQQIAIPRTEIFTPICSFIAMTVANNSCVQENFSASGALDTLTLAMVHQASAADQSLLSYQCAIIMAKTLSACVTDNPYLASGLAQYGVVSHLFSLLTSPHLEPEDRLSVLLTLGHCTDASEKHQSQLMQCGGLPLIINLLTEDADEEVRNAAAFILQTCKQAIMSLGVPGLIARQGDGKNEDTLANEEGFRNSARELLRRIERLEKRQGDRDEPEDTDPSASTGGQGQPSVVAGDDNKTNLQPVRNVVNNDKESDLNNVNPILSVFKKKAGTTAGDVFRSACTGSGAFVSSHPRPLEGGRGPHSADNQLFKPLAKMRQSAPNKTERVHKEGLQSHEISKGAEIPVEERSLSHIRCAGCVLSFEEVTSRTFTSLQSSCQHSCDMHKILLEATERSTTRLCKRLIGREYQGHNVGQTDPDSERPSAAEPQKSRNNWSDVCLTPIRKGGKSSPPEHHWKRGFTLIPLRRGAKTDPRTPHHDAGSSFTPMWRPRLPTDSERRGGSESGHDELKMSTDLCPTRKKRENFSHEEVSYLLSGVKAHGFSWNSILWSFPFKPGRTNVDLAKKYRQLMRSKAQNADCA